MNSRISPLARKAYTFAAALVVIGAAGLYYIQTVNASDPAPQAQAAPAVEVAELQPMEIRTWTRFSGRLIPVESAQIKPLVSGAIQQVLFQDGQQVRKGDVLFVIDPRPHQAQEQRTQAQLATARSRAHLAGSELDRAKQLFGSQLISQSIYDAALSAHQVAQAEVQAAESALSQARLNLEYAHISAPISGRIGRAELTVGNVVEAGPNAPVLTTLVANDRFYAEFNVDEQAYLQSARSLQQQPGSLQDQPGNLQQPSMPVELSLANGGGTVYHGKIHAFDNRLDIASGTIRARAIFDITDGLLTSGMYANLRLGSAATAPTLLVPERALGTNQDKKFVYVVDNNNTVQYREVQLGDHYQSHRVVEKGLAAGERVAVNSLAHLRPNTQINPVPVTTFTNQVAAH
jgi:membrane fusion protein, multidrug efflux system